MRKRAQFYFGVARTAKKPHQCCSCCGVINPGEQYHSHEGIWNGEFERHKVCADCELLRLDADANRNALAEHTGFNDLLDRVLEMDEDAITRRYIATCDKRGGNCPSWLRRRVCHE
jgi:hypothetical protein